MIFCSPSTGSAELWYNNSWSNRFTMLKRPRAIHSHCLRSHRLCAAARGSTISARSCACRHGLVVAAFLLQNLQIFGLFPSEWKDDEITARSRPPSSAIADSHARDWCCVFNRALLASACSLPRYCTNIKDVIRLSKAQQPVKPWACHGMIC